MFVYILLFFFFKQKTAYEMRISDWSSDVCSSDLAGPHAPHHRSKPVAHRDRPIGDKAAADIEVILRSTAHLRPSADDGNTHRGKEIGRASCRERVCQYV